MMMRRSAIFDLDGPPRRYIDHAYGGHDMQKTEVIAEWLARSWWPWTMWKREKLRREAVESDVEPLVGSAVQAVARAKDDEAFKVLEFIRKECQFEMNLIGTRITWMLAAQAVLVSGFVYAASNALMKRTNSVGWLAVLAWLISIVGIVISWRTIQALRQAKWTIELWHRRVRSLIRESRQEVRPWHAAILGRWVDPDDRVHTESLQLSHVVLPWVFTIFWVLLFALTAKLAIYLFRCRDCSPY
jgi:hypothetical protein